MVTLKWNIPVGRKKKKGGGRGEYTAVNTRQHLALECWLLWAFHVDICVGCYDCPLHACIAPFLSGYSVVEIWFSQEITMTMLKMFWHTFIDFNRWSKWWHRCYWRIEKVCYIARCMLMSKNDVIVQHLFDWSQKSVGKPRRKRAFIEDRKTAMPLGLFDM